MATLFVLQGPDKGRTFDVLEESAVIGKDADSVQLNDDRIAPEHARLWRSGGRWLLDDMGTEGGTYVNGVRVSREIPLNLGDQIRCGASLLVFGGQTSAAVPGSPDDVTIDKDGKLLDSAIMTALPAVSEPGQLAPKDPSLALDNLQVLYKLSSAISSLFNIDQLLERVMDLVFSVVEADRGFIMLIDPNSKELVPKAIRNREGLEREKITISHTIVDYVIRTREAVLASNAMRDKRFSGGQSVHHYGIRSAICAPIRAHDKVLGVIHVDSSVANITYTAEHLSLLTAIGYQTGLAVENARLYQSQLRAERLAATGETVAYLSHHIKNILQGLRGGADVVGQGLEADNIEITKKGWEIVERNLERIFTLSLNMLAFSKDRQPNRAATSLTRIIQDAAELARSRAEEKEIHLTCELDNSAPTLNVDPDGIHHALLNMLTNAVDAAPEQTGKIEVRFWIDNDRNMALISVTDNGHGIEPEFRDKVFQPFDSTKGARGTGLGMPVAKKIVEEHGGQLEFSSQVGKGTTFTMILPLDRK